MWSIFVRGRRVRAERLSTVGVSTFGRAGAAASAYHRAVSDARRVLIVDDDESVRQMLTAFFETTYGAGKIVVEAVGDGAAAEAGGADTAQVTGAPRSMWTCLRSSRSL